MIFVCPKCRSRLKIPPERLPAAGAWARCPKCQERFFLRRENPELPLAAPAAAPAVTRGAETRKLLERLRAKSGRPAGAVAAASADGPPWALDAVTVFPQPAPDPRLYGLAGALAAGGFLGFLFWSFLSAGASPEQAEASPPPPPARYEDRDLSVDLRALRRDLARRPGLSRKVTWRGPESRVFKYFLGRLEPDSCQELSSLRLWSPRPGAGFQAGGLCLTGAETPLLDFQWADGAVLASRAGRPAERLEFHYGPPPAGGGEYAGD